MHSKIVQSLHISTVKYVLCSITESHFTKRDTKFMCWEQIKKTQSPKLICLLLVTDRLLKIEFSGT